MPEKNLSLPCATAQPAPRRLHTPDAVVIIVIILAAAALSSTGLPVADVLQLLACAGLVAILLIGLGTAAPVKAIRAALRVAAGPAV
ncbi:hypothetical protein OHA91_39670 (plasmid) [Streptomyces erythrochromogenes]|uniref:Uncharacterized protein n=1 Tax=Streptomyces erythrochromogenes TaxID=285574 RepID=A0ABZ1QPS0_9ACTN|nr:hypothetical protein [Streptomyces erythrochromogenes]